MNKDCRGNVKYCINSTSVSELIIMRFYQNKHLKKKKEKEAKNDPLMSTLSCWHPKLSLYLSA